MPPYQYERRNLVHGPGSSLRRLQGDEMGRMLGFTSHHMSAVGKAFRRDQVEDQKQGFCANSFSAVVVARLLGSAVLPFSSQELDRGTLPQIWHRWGDLETKANLAAAQLKKGWTAQHGGAASSQSSAPPGSILTDAQKLVGKYLQLADHRGSDVRLDAGLPYRLSAWPKAPIDSGQWTWKVRLSYAWTSENHINILEAQAVFDYAQRDQDSLLS